MKQCIYISTACPINDYNSLVVKPSFAAYNFNKSILSGLVDNDITCYNLAFRSDSIKKSNYEIEDGVNYFRMPNTNCFKRFMMVIKEIYVLAKSNPDCFIICDYLNYINTLAAIIVSFFLKKDCVAVVTDLPEFLLKKHSSMVGKFKNIVFVKIGYFILNSFDKHVLLTNDMSKKIKSDKYIVMEGIANLDQFENIEKNEKKNQIMYAGGLSKEYGIINLLEGFVNCKFYNKYQLLIFGYGDEKDIEKIQLYSEKYKNVIYRGYANNVTVLREELNSALLVNPRPANQEFCKYSFPSKNIEYMLSGTPMLTTKLPSMPIEYYNYVYFFEDDSIESITNALNNVLEYSNYELERKGYEARNFIINNKNKTSQVKKILRIIK